MTEVSYPFVDGRTTDAEFSAMFERLFPSSVDGHYGSTDLEVYSDTTGLHVLVRPGAGFVRGHYYRNDDDLLLPIAPNTSTQARVDAVVLHLEYGTVKAINAAVVQGTPGGGNPALTNTPDGIAELLLGYVTVSPNASVIPPSNITDRRVWWGLELMRRFGLVVSASTPDPGSAFLHVKP